MCLRVMCMQHALSTRPVPHSQLHKYGAPPSTCPHTQERHGFNKQTPRLFVADLLKGALLAALLAPPLVMVSAAPGASHRHNHARVAPLPHIAACCYKHPAVCPQLLHATGCSLQQAITFILIKAGPLMPLYLFGLVLSVTLALMALYPTVIQPLFNK